MCGLAGQVSWAAPPDQGLVDRMTDLLRHRGPDSGGSLAIGPAVLGHRRLSVIDTRAVADQPMVDETGMFALVYNGEVYNFHEIRRDLEARGARFRTNSDTEVVLEAYKAWGLECLPRFNGMFAFALWDGPRRRLILARDRLGKKPLYYAPFAGGVTFSSELKSLRIAPTLDGALNPRALGQFLSLNYCHNSECILEGVAKLPPAHALIVEEGRPLEARRYWDLASHFKVKSRFRGRDEAAEALNALLDDAVRIRLVSDVPLGAFLSGGIDSSSVVASMCRLGDPAAVRTFSIGFGEEGFDEREEARFMAGALGVSHRDQVVGPEIAGRLAEIFHAADEPFADSSIIPTFALSEFARKHVTVALSGDGGDELFAGYETYVADKICAGLSFVPRSVAQTAAGLFGRLIPASRAKVGLDEKIRRFLGGLSSDSVAAHAAWRGIFSEPEKRALMQPGLYEASQAVDSLDDPRRFDAEVSGCALLDRMSYVDIKTWLVDDILVKVDRASMAHSLEVRAPFLDHRLVEFAAALPPDVKLKGFDKKHILKHSQRDRLPRQVIRRRKAGFSAPVAHWLSQPGQGIFAHLSPETLAGDLFQRQEVRRLCEEHWSRRADHGLKLLGLVALHLWRKRQP